MTGAIAKNQRAAHARGVFLSRRKNFRVCRSNGRFGATKKFFYVEALNDDVQRVFILLAKFGEFAGVGRLTGKGFGQVRVSAFARLEHDLIKQ